MLYAALAEAVRDACRLNKESINHISDEWRRLGRNRRLVDLEALCLDSLVDLCEQLV